MLPYSRNSLVNLIGVVRQVLQQYVPTTHAQRTPRTPYLWRMPSAIGCDGTIMTPRLLVFKSTTALWSSIDNMFLASIPRVRPPLSLRVQAHLFGEYQLVRGVVDLLHAHRPGRYLVGETFFPVLAIHHQHKTFFWEVGRSQVALVYDLTAVLVGLKLRDIADAKQLGW